MNAHDFLRPLADELEFESLRFPGEEVLRQQVERRPAAMEIVRRWCSLATCPAVPKGAHPEAFVASPAATPGLAQLARMLETILGLEARPELVVFPSPEVFVGPDASAPRSPFRVLVSSAALHRLGVREAMFQVGRRLAWRLFDHLPLLGDPTAGVAKPDHDALLIRGLWKFQELTCDRIGLLCCQDADLASRSVLRFASGLPDELLDVDWDALLGERIAEEEAMLADSPYQFALLRAAALRQFGAGDRFGECFIQRPKAIAVVAEATTSLPLEPEPADPIIDVTIVEAASEPPAAEPTLKTEFVKPAEEAEETIEIAAVHGLDAALEATLRDALEFSFAEPAVVTPPPPAQEVIEIPPAAVAEPELELEAAGDPGPTLAEPVKAAAPEPALEQTLDAGPAAEARRGPSAEEADALREFTLWGVLWVVGMEAPLGDLARAELWEYFGSEAAAAIDEAEQRDGDERCARRCASAAPLAARTAFELRRGAVEDVIHLALSAGPMGPAERDRLADLAELLDLTPDDVEQAAAEVVDPEFSAYAFREGEDVEAKFDDDWTAGVVHTVDPSGGVRVYFPSLAQTLWLSPTADLLRPLSDVSANRLV